MFAVIKTGGKQYKVAKDDVITVEKLAGEPGAPVDIGEVLLVGDEKDQTVGAPLVEGATVAAEVVEQKRDNKIIVFKKKRRKNYRRKNGHRQEVTVLKIIDILTGGKKRVAAKKKPATKKKDKEKPEAEAKPVAEEAPTEAEAKSEE
jgi:large subunit ribosomal protein L21